MENYFTGRDITPLEIFHPKLSFRIPVTVEILFSQVRPFLDPKKCCRTYVEAVTNGKNVPN